MPSSKANKKEIKKWKIIVKTIKMMEEEDQMVKLTNQWSQGSLMIREVLEGRLVHKEVIYIPEGQLKLFVNSVSNLLSTPSNITNWRGTEKWHMLGDVETTAHILSGRQTALSKGQWRWWHHEFLQERDRQRVISILISIYFIRIGWQFQYNIDFQIGPILQIHRIIYK